MSISSVIIMATGMCLAVAITAPVPTITNRLCPESVAAARKMWSMSGRRNIRVRYQVGDFSRSKSLAEHWRGFAQQTPARAVFGQGRGDLNRRPRQQFVPHQRVVTLVRVRRHSPRNEPLGVRDHGWVGHNPARNFAGLKKVDPVMPVVKANGHGRMLPAGHQMAQQSWTAPCHPTRASSPGPPTLTAWSVPHIPPNLGSG
jgi:hypothetical protein